MVGNIAHRALGPLIRKKGIALLTIIRSVRAIIGMRKAKRERLGHGARSGHEARYPPG